jgi:hypothetical protein
VEADRTYFSKIAREGCFCLPKAVFQPALSH